jgi:hypothetical protein
VEGGGRKYIPVNCSHNIIKNIFYPCCCSWKELEGKYVFFSIKIKLYEKKDKSDFKISFLCFQLQQHSFLKKTQKNPSNL